LVVAYFVGPPRIGLYIHRHTIDYGLHRMAQKSKPLPNDQKIVLNRIKACRWD